MRIGPSRTAALAALVAALWAAPACAAPAATGSPPSGGLRPFGQAGDRAPGEYLVTVEAGQGEPAVRLAFGAYGVVAVRQVRDDLFLVRLETDPGPDAAERQGLAAGGIRAVQPNLVYRAQPPR